MSHPAPSPSPLPRMLETYRKTIWQSYIDSNIVAKNMQTNEHEKIYPQKTSCKLEMDQIKQNIFPLGSHHVDTCLSSNNDLDLLCFMATQF